MRLWLRRHWWTLTAVAVLPGFVFLTVNGAHLIRVEQDLDDRGVEVPAEVLHIAVDDSGDSPTSDVTVRFKPRGDVTERVVTDVTYDGDFRDDYPRARREGVRIEYDPDHPSQARLAGGDDMAEAIAEFVFGVLGLLAVVGFFGWALARKRL